MSADDEEEEEEEEEEVFVVVVELRIVEDAKMGAAAASAAAATAAAAAAIRPSLSSETFDDDVEVVETVSFRRETLADTSPRLKRRPDTLTGNVLRAISKGCSWFSCGASNPEEITLPSEELEEEEEEVNWNAPSAE